MFKQDLVIPFSMKDILKKNHPIKFDLNRKIWYIFCNDDLPEDLKKYKRMNVEIDYNDKEIMKKRFDSLRYDFNQQSWFCSLEDFEKMGKI
jgi:hypothetical protein